MCVWMHVDVCGLHILFVSMGDGKLRCACVRACDRSIDRIEWGRSILIASTFNPNPTHLTHNPKKHTGIPVLVLHGLLGSGRNFRSWASTLHDRLSRPRRVLVPDLRNHGGSPHVHWEEGGMSYR